MTSDLRERVAARLGGLLARLVELVDADPARELAPVPGDFHGPPGWPIDAAPKAWPEGLPWPLTARQALEHLQAAQLDAVAWVESDIRAAVAWLVDPKLEAVALSRPDLVDKWRWPWLTAPVGNGAEWCGPSYGWRLALGRLLRSWGADLPPADAGIWPKKQLSHGEVAEWARPVLNLRRPAKPVDPRTMPGVGNLAHGQGLWDGAGELSEEVAAAAFGLTLDEWRKEYPGKPALGDELVADVESWGEIRRELVARRVDGLPCEVHRTTLALLYLVEQQARESLPGELLAVALATVRAWSSPDPSGVHDTAARGALEKEKGPAEARELLARELWGECAALLVARLTQSAEPGELREVPERGGLMALDAELVDWLAERDQGEADALRAAAGERLGKWRAGELGALELFARWLDGRALLPVAGVLWRARVAGLWKRKQTVRPALVRAVAADVLVQAMTRQAVLPGLDDGAVRDKRGREVARIDVASMDATALDVVRRGLDLLGSVTAHRLVRKLVHRVHDQWEAQAADPRAVDFVGGHTALAAELHDSERDPSRLRAILEAGQRLQWTHPTVTVGGLWTWTDRRGSPGRPGLVRIVVGDALAPTLAARLSDDGNTSFSARRARKLVPELHEEPPVSAVRNNDQGAAWTLHRLVLVELVDNASELAVRGSVAISAERWRELANLAGLPLVGLAALRASWLTGDNTNPPLLCEPERGRFTLALDPHAAGLAFIVAGGRRSLAGAGAAREGKRSKER